MGGVSESCCEGFVGGKGLFLRRRGMTRNEHVQLMRKMIHMTSICIELD